MAVRIVLVGRRKRSVDCTAFAVVVPRYFSGACTLQSKVMRRTEYMYEIRRASVVGGPRVSSHTVTHVTLTPHSHTSHRIPTT